jgi:hypothetical protein
MSDKFKVLILPADLNDTPNREDLVLIVTKDEFLRMWRRGQTMLRNWQLKGQEINGDFRRSLKLS